MNTSPIGQWHVETLQHSRQGLRAEREKYAVQVEAADQCDGPVEVHVAFFCMGAREERLPASKWREMLVVAGELVSRVEVGR